MGDRELLELVLEAIETGAALDRLLVVRLYGSWRGRPRTWGEWQQHERDSWDQAVRIYDRVRGEMQETERPMGSPNGGPRPGGHPPTLEQSWDAVLELSSRCPPREWWLLPFTDWAELAAVVSLGPRATQHWFQRLGWEFEGRYDRRRVQVAPCRSCGGPWTPETLIGHSGPCCAEEVASAST